MLTPHLTSYFKCLYGVKCSKSHMDGEISKRYLTLLEIDIDVSQIQQVSAGVDGAVNKIAAEWYRRNFQLSVKILHCRSPHHTKCHISLRVRRHALLVCVSTSAHQSIVDCRSYDVE